MANLKNNSETTQEDARLQAYTEMNAVRAESKLHGIKTQDVADCLGMSVDSLYNILAARSYNIRKAEQFQTIAAMYRMLIDKKIAEKKARKSNASQLCEIPVTFEVANPEDPTPTEVAPIVIPDNISLQGLTGVSRRDYFAVTILNGIYASNTQRTGKEPEAAVKIADKLIYELKKS